MLQIPNFIKYFYSKLGAILLKTVSIYYILCNIKMWFYIVMLLSKGFIALIVVIKVMNKYVFF